MDSPKGMQAGQTKVGDWLLQASAHWKGAMTVRGSASGGWLRVASDLGGMTAEWVAVMSLIRYQ